MTIAQMRYYVAVCETKSFTKAAQRLNVTQPAISSAVKELERECSVALFDRSKNKLQLTEEGQILLEVLQPALKQLDEIEYTIGNLHQIKKCLRVGFATLFGNYVYSGILTQFVRNYPDVQISATEASVDRLFRMLDDNQLDIILAVSKRSEDSSESPYKELPIVNTAMRFCVNSEHPLAWNQYVSWEEMAQVPLVMMSERFNLTESLLREFHSRGLEPRVIHYTDQVYTVERFIENNAAGGFLPEIVASRNRFITGITYGDRKKLMFLKAIWRRDRFLSQSLKQFIETIQKYAENAIEMYN